MIPVEKDDEGRPEISRQAVYYRFRNRCRDGSLKNVRDNSTDRIRDCLNLSGINFDGTQTVAGKGGESAAWQGRKKAETGNMLTVSDKNGNPAASEGITAGNHNDAYEPENSLRDIFREMKNKNLPFKGAYFNADASSDTSSAGKICFSSGAVPDTAENMRNRKYTKRGRRRLSDREVYQNRFRSGRTSAWADKFRRLLIRSDRNNMYFFGFHCTASAMICLRNLTGQKKFKSVLS